MKLPEFNEEQKNFISQFKFDDESGNIFFSNLQSMLREHYEHSRHQEWQRTTFTTILGAIVAAIISSYDKLPLDLQLRLGVFVAGLALSFIGFLLMYTWNRPFIRHYMLTEMIVVYYFKLPWLRRTRTLDPKKVKRFDSLFDPTSGNVFYLLTSLFTLLFAFLIGYTQKGELTSGIYGALIALGILIPIRFYFGYQETQARKQILERHFAKLNTDINKSPFNSSTM
jgi:MFS family permease